MFLGSDSEGLVELAALLEDVGDLALRDGAQAGVTKSVVGW